MRKFDYSKIKEKKLDLEILNYIAKIEEFKGKQEVFLNQKPKILGLLTEIAIIQSTESSNEIEGIRTANARIKELVQKKIKPKNRDEKEILGYRDVLATIHESYEYIPVSEKIILQLHRDLFKYSNKATGRKFKSTQNYIQEIRNGETFIRFKPLDPFETVPAIKDICETYNREIDKGEIHPLILIPIFIHDFLCIHPFNDGNGRMSRLLTTLLLYKNGYFIGKYISIEEKIEKTKDIYYEELKKSGKNWHENNEDPRFFIKYILSMILSAYRDFEERVDIFNVKKSAFEKVKETINDRL